MTYLHCPSCGRAYNLAVCLACPSCGVLAGGAPKDPVDDVVAMAEQLARAIARATPEQIDAARERLGFALGAGPPPPVIKALPAPPSPEPRYMQVARAGLRVGVELARRYVPRRAQRFVERAIRFAA